jgi:Restriction endonuclease
MIFSEQDIDFTSLTSTQFESLCYDVLAKQGFHSLSWRQGGSDNGRDIEAQRTLENPLTGTYSEKWFIECKNWSHGLPVDEISSKIDWAEAESAEHLVVLTSSYLTTATRTWLEKRLQKCSFRFHEVDGKKLKCILLLPGYEDLVEKWFLGKPEKLFLDKFKEWKEYGFFPSIDIFQFFFENLSLNKLTSDEIAFLWIVFAYGFEDNRSSEVDRSLCLIYEQLRDLTLQNVPISSDESPLKENNWKVLMSSLRKDLTEYGTDLVSTTLKALLGSPDQPFGQGEDTFYFCRRFSEMSGIEVLLSRSQEVQTKSQLRNFNPLLGAISQMQILRNDVFFDEHQIL